MLKRTAFQTLRAVPAAAFLALAGAPSAYAGDPAIDTGSRYKGVRQPTLEQVIELHQRRIKNVRPNLLAIERANDELRKQGRPEIDCRNAVRPENEIEIDSGAPVHATRASAEPAVPAGMAAAASAALPAPVTALPVAVDNSALSAAPPIGDQGAESSSLAFAVTYYQASHETCLARGCDNKASNDNVMSPKWTYNMINGGTDGGAWFTEAYKLHQYNGSASLGQLPYAAGDYRSWDLHPADWRAALGNRMNPVQALGGVGSSSGLAMLKQLLANGHVATFATYAGSWQFTRVGADPDAPSPYAGQYVMSYVNGTDGAHAMTVVGYDDTVWTDLNGNGVVDPGEQGALKVANSWGSGWGNGGFIWIAYDALAAASAVAGGPASSTRQPALWNDAVYAVLAKSSYSPRLIAEFTVNHAARGQMTLAGGISASTSGTPTSLAASGALQAQGGGYAFDGGTAAIDASFVLDLTDLIPSAPASTSYYLKLLDSAVGNPLALQAVKLVNLPLNQEIPANAALPLSVDGTTRHIEIPYSYFDANQLPVARIAASPVAAGGGLSVSFDGTGSYDPDGSIVSYSWDFGDGSPPQSNSIVTHFYADAGSYNARLTVTDNLGAGGIANHAVSVPDVLAPSAPSGLTAALASEGKSKKAAWIALAWQPARDNVGIAAYDVYRNGSRIASTASTSYSDAGTLAGGGTYTYYVVARDAASNVSPASNAASVTR